MATAIKFNSLVREEIFTQDFLNFESNNVIEFKKSSRIFGSDQGMAVLYGPNGTGKTSLAKVLSGESGNYKLEFDEQIYENDSELFHIINDQNGRNIIKGETEDFLLGDQIKKERLLKKQVDERFIHLFSELFHKGLRNDFMITKQSSKLIDLIEDSKLKGFVKKIVNIKDKGASIDINEFIDKIKSLTRVQIEEPTEQLKEKMNFFKDNYSETSSILYIINYFVPITMNKMPDVYKIEENDEAIKILVKFSHKDECIVCENKEFNSEELLKKKEDNMHSVISSLDEQSKSLLNDIIKVVGFDRDPFEIKRKLMLAISKGEISHIEELKVSLKECFIRYNYDVNNFFKDTLSQELIDLYEEYMELLKSQIEIEEEDVLYIQEVISENIGKRIELKRDESNSNNFLILLEGNPLLGQDRDTLNLSNGEQNFISLAFELLKARNSPKKIVVLDDPISSFDSIYKNKIAYSIVKFLDQKKQLILSHNTDLIRLLEHQLKGCFNLYLFNNTLGEENGFIPIERSELDFLIDISKLTKFLRVGVLDEIEDERLFLMSAVPFMRSYANLVGNSEEYTKLSRLMHGYETSQVDITKIYNELLGAEVEFATSFNITAKDIIELDLSTIKIFKEGTSFPLLAKALRHTLSYLNLRLKVEKVLIDTFEIPIHEGDKPLLTNIIVKALKDNKNERIFFTSRKTLLNEFNHFEGNMNIFQPAIDITDKALKEEIGKINEHLERIIAEQTVTVS